MRKIAATVLLGLMATSPASYAEILPDWVENIPKGHNIYCVPVTNDLETARKIASLFAGEDMGLGIEHSEVTGKETARSTSINGDVHSRYEMDIEIVSTGEAPQVLVVNETMIDDELCVLIKAG
ncbi:putative Excinuclease ABC subunit A [Vibrio crassostreae]|nr:conserved exported hypothetical protein [Vibrio chagasii]CAK2840265.1 putative Excinuclease ABC subunit A [Vibrio crassostreae]